MPDFQHVVGRELAQLQRIEQPLFAQPVARQTEREFGPVDRHARQLGHHVGQSADVVLVAVRQNDRLTASRFSTR
jgi:hypothetical protein